ncbi:MAG: hypothetical protein SWJ54_22335 [Cyanobacteriota bacterium]|nr:hypothetical protein [Cyanobacteriota bacterium]
MKSIEAIATVTADGQLILQVPRDILPGNHRIVLVIDEHLEVDSPSLNSDVQLPNDDPIFGLGKNPIKCGIPDAANMINIFITDTNGCLLS